ncbi:S8 family serine peptidase [Mycetocola sp. 2940]|uniref:S8 family peptidase n=1 Tax=Mycetocola sp. 2940 TaxID=3156452 RepID=UPI0033943E27
MDDSTEKTRLRVHEMRIAVQAPASGFRPDDLADVLCGVLADWEAAPLLEDDDTLWLISGHVEEQIGTGEYARKAHSLVQAVLGTGTVTRAEADLPVTAFVDPARDRGAASDAPGFPPGSEASRWARDAIRCDEAWAIEPTRGDGIRIGHPDTGYTLHPNLGVDALDLTRDRDFLANDDDARDPLVSPDDSPWPLPFPGHGTTTASVMTGQGTEATGIVGVAPGARVVPLRAVESVIQLFDSDVARAVDHARTTGCHVVSISVGGKGFFGLEAAIQRAVDAGMIVLGAAGNNVGIVVAPASYPNCLAVAATGPDDQPWPESSRGRAVDVSAPGWGVHVAGYVWVNDTPRARVFRSSGTSYAVTHLAGVAALWLAHHGPDTLRERYGPRVQSVFLTLLKTGGAKVPAGWDSAAFGAGIVDAAAMLSAALPAESAADRRAGVPQASALARLGALVGADEAQLRHALTERLGMTGEDLDRAVERFEGELAFHLIDEPLFRESLLGEAAGDLMSFTAPATCSPEFALAFLGAAPEGQC